MPSDGYAGSAWQRFWVAGDWTLQRSAARMLFWWSGLASAALRLLPPGGLSPALLAPRRTEDDGGPQKLVTQ